MTKFLPEMIVGAEVVEVVLFALGLEIAGFFVFVTAMRAYTDKTQYDLYTEKSQMMQMIFKKKKSRHGRDLGVRCVFVTKKFYFSILFDTAGI